MLDSARYRPRSRATHDTPRSFVARYRTRVGRRARAGGRPGSTVVDARLRPVLEDEPADSRIVDERGDCGHVGRRRPQPDVHARPEGVSLRHGHAPGHRGGRGAERGCRTRRSSRGRTRARRPGRDAPGRAWPQRRPRAAADPDDRRGRRRLPERRRGTRPPGRLRGLARRQAQGVLSRSQPLGRELRRHERKSDHDRRQREDARQVRHGQLGLRRRAEPDDGDLVVARQRARRLLPLRRRPGEGFLPADESDGDPGRARRRGVPEAGAAESDRRHLRLQRRGRRIDARRHSRRQALLERRRRSLRVRRALVAGWHGAFRQPDEPPSEHHGVRRVRAGHRQVPRRRARGMADRLGRQPSADAPARRQQALHLGVGSQRILELLPLRSDRQANQSDHDERDVRVGSDRQARRAGGRDVLHGARRRQLHEVAAPSRRPRRQGRRAA